MADIARGEAALLIETFRSVESTVADRFSPVDFHARFPRELQQPFDREIRCRAEQVKVLTVPAINNEHRVDTHLYKRLILSSFAVTFLSRKHRVSDESNYAARFVRCSVYAIDREFPTSSNDQRFRSRSLSPGEEIVRVSRLEL